MSKSLEELLSSTTEDDTVTVSTDESVTATDPAAVATITEESDESVAVTVENEDTTATTLPDQEIDGAGATETQVEQEEEVVAPEVDSTFVPYVIHLNKAATLYGNQAATKVIGAFKGTVRQIAVAINGVAPIEYTVISAGNKIVKRAFIHI